MFPPCPSPRKSGFPPSCFTTPSQPADRRPFCSALSAAYLKRQAEHYAQGIPAPDFPQGQGESLNVGRSTPNEITDPTARQMLGLEPMAEDGATEGEREVLREANRILFG